ARGLRGCGPAGAVGNPGASLAERHQFMGPILDKNHRISGAQGIVWPRSRGGAALTPGYLPLAPPGRNASSALHYFRLRATTRIAIAAREARPAPAAISGRG